MKLANAPKATETPGAGSIPITDAIRLSGKSYAEVARACGVHWATLWSWRTGRRAISAVYAKRLSAVLGAPVEGKPLKNFLPLEDGYPIPEPLKPGLPGQPRPSQQVPWSSMEVGQSCFVPAHLTSYGTVMWNASNAGLRLGRKFRARKAEKDGIPGCRVWRIE